MPRGPKNNLNSHKLPRETEGYILSPMEMSTELIVSSWTGHEVAATIPLGFQGFAAPRVLVLHTLRTLMSTHVLELGRPSVATPVLLVFLDPKMKATNSPENAI